MNAVCFVGPTALVLTVSPSVGFHLLHRECFNSKRSCCQAASFLLLEYFYWTLNYP